MSPLFRSQAYRHVGEAGLRPRRPSSATERVEGLLESYEDPGIDDGVDEELREYIARRKREIDE